MQKAKNPVKSGSQIGQVPSLYALQSTHEMRERVLVNHLITVPKPVNEPDYNTTPTAQPIKKQEILVHIPKDNIIKFACIC
jgi:hypothetical protein